MKGSSALFAAIFAAAYVAVALGASGSSLLNKDSPPPTSESSVHPAAIQHEEALNEPTTTTISTTSTTEITSIHPEVPLNTTSSNSNSTQLPTAQGHTDAKPHNSSASSASSAPSTSIYFGLILVALAPVFC